MTLSWYRGCATCSSILMFSMSGTIACAIYFYFIFLIVHKEIHRQQDIYIRTRERCIVQGVMVVICETKYLTQSAHRETHIYASGLFGAKPLSQPMLTYCQEDHKEHISINFYLKFKSFHSRKCIWKCGLQNGCHLVSFCGNGTYTT